MLWWIGSGLVLLWIILQLVAPRGWVPMLLIAGVTLLIVQIAAYRKEKATAKHR